MILNKQGMHDTSDTDPDTDAEPAGAGPKGVGPPMLVGTKSRARPLCDGAGLCSTGVWPPWSRPESQSGKLREICALVNRAVDAWVQGCGTTAEDLFDRLAAGQIQEDPVPPRITFGLTEQVTRLFDECDEPARRRPGDRDQIIHIRLLMAIMREAQDPDVAGMWHYCRGVKLGVNHRMPRTPAVFEPKRRWRLQEQYEAEYYYGADAEGHWRDNYKSAQTHVDLIDRQLQDHVSRGLAFQVTAEEMKRLYPQGSIVSLGAVSKIDTPTTPDDIRIVMDGTHGVQLNKRIKPRDQDRCPTASDVKRLQREQGLTSPAVGLAVDVKEAHRLPPVHESDWQHQACRAKPDGPVIVYKFGVFGFASSAYWWARLGGALIRSLLRVAPPCAALWTLLMADDLKLESTAEQPKKWIVWAIMFLRMLGVPLSWRKLQGGTELIWIGYSVRLWNLSLGISASRAAWATAWLRRAARDGVVDIADLRSCLGRLSFIAGAMEYDRPFLAPLFGFVALYPSNGLRSVPLYARLIMNFLADRLERRRHYPSAVARSKSGEPFRVDAHAEGMAVGVGGWLPALDDHGNINLGASKWFAETLDRDSAPWAYHRGLPFKTIASLEALASLMGVLAFCDERGEHSDCTLIVPGYSDNRGNKFALSYLQSSKYPLCVLLMELACQLENRAQRLQLSWVPRELNDEADRLSRGDTSGFCDANRVRLRPDEVKWEVLHKYMDLGLSLEKLKRPRGEATGRRVRPTKRVPFRERDPW